MEIHPVVILLQTKVTNRPCHAWSQTILGTSWDDPLFSDTVCYFIAEIDICVGVIHSFSVLCWK